MSELAVPGHVAKQKQRMAQIHNAIDNYTLMFGVQLSQEFLNQSNSPMLDAKACMELARVFAFATAEKIGVLPDAAAAYEADVQGRAGVKKEFEELKNRLEEEKTRIITDA